MRYNRGSFQSTIRAAIKTSSAEHPAYVFATAYGYTIGNSRPPFHQNHYRVCGQVVELIEHNPETGQETIETRIINA